VEVILVIEAIVEVEAMLAVTEAIMRVEVLAVEAAKEVEKVVSFLASVSIAFVARMGNHEEE